MNYRLPVEPARPGAAPPKPDKQIPGPVDADEYERTHGEAKDEKN